MASIRCRGCCLAWQLPTVLAQLVNLLYNMVDRAFVGHIAQDVGPLALAGLGPVLPVTMIRDRPLRS